MCLDKSPILGDVMTTESQKQNIQAILGLLEQSGEVESAQTEQSTSVLCALHLITSALDGENALLCAAITPDIITSPRFNPQSLKRILELRCFCLVLGSLSFRNDIRLPCCLGNVLQSYSVKGPGVTG